MNTYSVWSVYTASDMIARDPYIRHDIPKKRRWKTLLSRLQPVDMNNVERVALDCKDPSGEWRNDDEAQQLEREEIYELLGGVEGVERLEANGRTLVHLAAHLQSETSTQDDVAGNIFLSFRSMWWHMDRLRLAAESCARWYRERPNESELHRSTLEFYFVMYGRNAAVDYYFLTRKFFELYKKRRPSRLEVLRHALQL